MCYWLHIHLLVYWIRFWDQAALHSVSARYCFRLQSEWKQNWLTSCPYCVHIFKSKSEMLCCLCSEVSPSNGARYYVTKWCVICSYNRCLDWPLSISRLMAVCCTALPPMYLNIKLFFHDINRCTNIILYYFCMCWYHAILRELYTNILNIP